jgi:sulfur-carrier protein
VSTVRVEIPYHLRTLAGVKGEIALDVAGAVSIQSVLDELEARYPMLEGTIRDHDSLQRRAFLRFFVCGEDWSHEPTDKPLPGVIATGKESLLIIGAIAGGTDRPRYTRLRRQRDAYGGGRSRWSRERTSLEHERPT